MNFDKLDQLIEKKATVIFLAPMDEVDGYGSVHPGMRARLSSRTEPDDLEDEAFNIQFDFEGFNTINQPFEPANIYDPETNPEHQMQSGYYRDVETYQLENIDIFDDLIEVVLD